MTPAVHPSQNAGRARDTNAQVLHVSPAKRGPDPGQFRDFSVEPLWWSQFGSRETDSDLTLAVLKPKFEAMIPDFRAAKTHLIQYIKWCLDFTHQLRCPMRRGLGLWLRTQSTEQFTRLQCLLICVRILKPNNVTKDLSIKGLAQGIIYRKPGFLSPNIGISCRFSRPILGTWNNWLMIACLSQISQDLPRSTTPRFT